MNVDPPFFQCTSKFLLFNPIISISLESFKDENSLDNGVDELIRFVGPAQGTSRFATQETILGDITLTLLAAANRDPEVQQLE